jgi:mannitol-1-phosphate/altronate dehydrogenase
VVAALTDYLHGPDNPAAVQAQLAAHTTKIVSLTTSSGANPRTEKAERPDLYATADWAGRTGGPWGVLGHLVAGLQARRGAGVGGVTALSCDDIPANGDVLRAAVLASATSHNPTLARWIEEEVTFPNSIFRVAPAEISQATAVARDRFGVLDDLAVRIDAPGEWIVEDRFCAGRPPLDTVDVQLVDDLTPYRAGRPGTDRSL